MMKCNFPTDSLYENPKLCDDYNKELLREFLLLKGGFCLLFIIIFGCTMLAASKSLILNGCE